MKEITVRKFRRKIQKNMEKIEKNFYHMLEYMDKGEDLYVFDDYISSQMWIDYKYNNGNLRFKADRDIHMLAEKFWEPGLAPFVAEILYTYNLCYHNQYENLFGMITADSIHYGETFYKEKLMLLSLAYGYGDVDFWLGSYRKKFDHQEIKQVAQAISDGGWEKYYEQITLPFMYSITVYGAHDEALYGGIRYEDDPDGKCDWESIAERLHVEKELDRSAVKFLIEDAYDYIWGCDCDQYNPFWIYGSKVYPELIRENYALPWKEWWEQRKINSRKNAQEYVRKAEETAKETEIKD